MVLDHHSRHFVLARLPRPIDVYGHAQLCKNGANSGPGSRTDGRSEGGAFSRRHAWYYDGETTTAGTDERTRHCWCRDFVACSLRYDPNAVWDILWSPGYVSVTDRAADAQRVQLDPGFDGDGPDMAFARRDVRCGKYSDEGSS